MAFPFCVISPGHMAIKSIDIWNAQIYISNLDAILFIMSPWMSNENLKYNMSKYKHYSPTHLRHCS